MRREGAFDNRIFRFGASCAWGRMKGCFLLSAADKMAGEKTYEASAPFWQGRKEKAGFWAAHTAGAWPQKSELLLLWMKSRLLEERRDGKHREERCLVTAGCTSIYNSCASSKNSQYAVIPQNNRMALLGSFTNPSDRWMQTEGAH